MIRRKNTKTMTASRVVKAGLAVAALMVPISLAIPAGAEDEISVAPDTPVRGEPGSVHAIASQAVPAELVGQACDLKVTSVNGGSVHPGNTLTVRTGDHAVTVDDVESASDATLHRLERVTMGDTLSVDITLGDEGLSSLGFNVGFECTPEDLQPEVKPAQQVNTGDGSDTTDTTPATTDDTPSPLPAAQPANATTAEPTFTG